MCPSHRLFPLLGSLHSFYTHWLGTKLWMPTDHMIFLPAGCVKVCESICLLVVLVKSLCLFVHANEKSQEDGGGGNSPCAGELGSPRG